MQAVCFDPTWKLEPGERATSILDWEARQFARLSDPSSEGALKVVCWTAQDEFTFGLNDDDISDDDDDCCETYDMYGCLPALRVCCSVGCACAYVNTCQRCCTSGSDEGDDYDAPANGWEDWYPVDNVKKKYKKDTEERMADFKTQLHDWNEEGIMDREPPTLYWKALEDAH